MRYALYYVSCVNLVAIFLTIYDKIAAKNDWTRVPERTLFLWTLLGGGAGMIVSMLFIRHKTQHRYFMIGIPLIIIWQVLLIAGTLFMLSVRGSI